MSSSGVVRRVSEGCLVARFTHPWGGFEQRGLLQLYRMKTREGVRKEAELEEGEGLGAEGACVVC
jgi:hypothetical protein